MIHPLKASEFEKASSLFHEMDDHLAPQAALEGSTPGAVWADDLAEPRSAILQTGHRFYLAGFERNDHFNGALRRLFLKEIYPQALAAGEEDFVLYYAPGTWAVEVEGILAGKWPMQLERQYYAFKGLRHDWREMVLPGFAVRQVDEAILGEDSLGNADVLRREIVSECPSQEFFLQHRFGYCLVGQGEIAGWCLSEYNDDDRCELGIETVDAFRRQGVATITASATIEHALTHGVTEIGWHCYASNVPSSATARKVGFEKVRDYAVFYACFDEVANLAVNGNVCLQRAQYGKAVAWYERAFAAGEVPSWTYLRAASANAMAGKAETALWYVGQAVQQGAADAETLKNSRYLESLQDTAEWRKLVEGLA
jgi:RimJ/RimL family protein N-acetyltransferase